ncbi:hypothetical protein [Arthrobacter sp. USHLN218]|uniref:hypothetical protein n=1 Tax=Arthrobacter sp. USHLN218 TaxID=3081232 RepID=UPI00301697F8
MSMNHAVSPGDAAQPVSAGTLDDVGHNAVDTYEVAARLEASGLTDRQVAKQHDVDGIFALSRALFKVHTGETVRSREWLDRTELKQAALRAAVLLCGCVLAALTQIAFGSPPEAVMISGSAAWVVGQACAGTSWARAGAGQLDQGLARGIGMGVMWIGALAAAFALAQIAGLSVLSIAVMTFGWCTYAITVNLLVVIGRTTALVRLLLPAVVLITGTLMVKADWTRPVAAGAILLTLMVLVALLLRELRRVGEARRPDRDDVAASWAPVLHASFLAATLLSVLFLLPNQHAPALIAATVVGAALADPALVLYRQRLRWATANTYYVHFLARSARYAALALSAITAVVAIVVVVTAVTILDSNDAAASTTAVSAGVFSTLATISTALTAFGASWRSVFVAVLAFAVVLIWWAVGHFAVTIALLVAIPVSILFLMQRVSDPRVLA